MITIGLTAVLWFVSGELPRTIDLPTPVVDSDYYDDGAPPAAKVELGRLLFFDKLLSGNRNISCATCHHPELGTSDGLALPLGEGPRGLGEHRRPGESKAEGVLERVPRNSPALFNLGAREFQRMFHDGRVEVDENGYYDSGFVTPMKWKFPEGLDNALAAQALFPVTSPTEMAGQQGENDVANARALNNVAAAGGVWDEIATRLREFPEYVDLFRAAFPELVESKDDVTMVLAANAIAAFEAVAFRADRSPFDAFLRGQGELSRAQTKGMQLFYGKAGCSDCHSGKFQTDHDFHAIGMPQIGPGKADGFDADYWSRTGIKAFVEDFGRGRVTVRTEDRYKFRTPSLRNVTLTGPWGHDGAYKSLEAVVRHHLDPLRALSRYELDDDHLSPIGALLEFGARGSRLEMNWVRPKRLVGILARDGWIQDHDELRGRIADANELEGRDLSENEVHDVIAFLGALTDPSSEDLMHEVPARVPSGLPIDD